MIERELGWNVYTLAVGTIFFSAGLVTYLLWVGYTKGKRK